MAQANAIANLANDLQTQINRLDAMEQSLRAGWKGRAANAFLARASELRMELNTQRQQMVNLATAIRNTANAIQQADEKVAKKAATLQ